MLSRHPALVILLLTPACATPEPQASPPPAPPAAAAPASVMGEIVAANVSWGDALVRGDSTRLASFYTDDAVLMTATGDVTGRPAIVAALWSSRRANGDSIHATAASTNQLDVAGDRAYEAGTLVYTLVSSNGTPRKVTVRFVNFWQLAAGRWQLRRSFRPLP